MQMADKWVVQINEERQEARLDARKYDLSVRKHRLPKEKKMSILSWEERKIVE